MSGDVRSVRTGGLEPRAGRGEGVCLTVALQHPPLPTLHAAPGHLQHCTGRRDNCSTQVISSIVQVGGIAAVMYMLYSLTIQ